MQISLFDGNKPFKITKPIRLIELFAGIGAQAKALKNIGADFEHYRICEFDKYAVQSYNAIHGTDFKTSDITEITAEDLAITDTENYCYIMTYSFPCTDLSMAGKRAGMSKGTRSGLLWEVERLLKETKELPQVLLMENVPQVLKADGWAEWVAFLDGLGYKSKHEILNAKHFDIPQNRARCFMVSILGDYFYDFPHGRKLKKRLNDMLEPEPVDKKYYLSQKMVDFFVTNTQKQLQHAQGEEWTIILFMAKTLRVKMNNYVQKQYIKFFKKHGYIPQVFNPYNCAEIVDIAPTITCECGSTTTSSTVLVATGGGMSEIKLKQVAQIKGKGFTEMTGRIYDPNGLSPTIQTLQGGNREPKIKIEKDNLLVYDEQNRYIRKDNIVGAIMTDGSSPKHNSRIIRGNDIRKLTPRECVRLMAFTDTDFDKIKAVGMSDSQCYKQAGNSIVVTVLEAIFKEMIKFKEEENT